MKFIEDAKREWKQYVVIILGVLMFRSVLFEPFKIPSGSMIPTLLIGDYILVNKYSYGFKVPFVDWFGDPVYITGPEEPKRGDVIVFKYPRDESLNYIKRLVGLPGDTIEIIDKVVYVNGEEIDAEPIDGTKFMEDMDDKYKSSQFDFKFFKTTTGGQEHITQHDDNNIALADNPKITVPAGHYFVLGDNRDVSADSRFWGFVPFENIKGKAIFVWFSMSIPWPWEDPEITFKFRPWRIGNSIK